MSSNCPLLKHYPRARRPVFYLGFAFFAYMLTQAAAGANPISNGLPLKPPPEFIDDNTDFDDDTDLPIDFPASPARTTPASPARTTEGRMSNDDRRPKFDSPTSMAIVNCVNEAIRTGQFEKVNVGGAGLALDLRCNADAARTLYIVLGQIGIAEEPVQFGSKESGTQRVFGASHCYIVQRKPDETPVSIPFCRLTFGVGQLVLTRF